MTGDTWKKRGGEKKKKKKEAAGKCRMVRGWPRATIPPREEKGGGEKGRVGTAKLSLIAGDQKKEKKKERTIRPERGSPMSAGGAPWPLDPPPTATYGVRKGGGKNRKKKKRTGCKVEAQTS